jgi:hypothetical protein
VPARQIGTRGHVAGGGGPPEIAHQTGTSTRFDSNL